MFKFYEKRGIYFLLSAVILVAGVLAIVFNGVDLDTEFKGGTVIRYEYTGELSDTAFSDAASEAIGGRSANCQIITDFATQKNYMILTLAGNEGLSSEEQEILKAKLVETFPDASLSVAQTSVVEPSIGERFFRDGITAIIIAFILIILYMWYAFRRIGGLLAGLAAVIALIHDCIIVFLIFVFFRIPLNENFVAAVLTIIGFSVNDTIVIFDRVRENNNLYGAKMSLAELTNKSITQSLSRSINTNVCVFISILIVYIFAQIYNLDTIISFALPMTFGVISGCYSTICLAGPLWVMMRGENKKIAKGKR